MCNGRNYCILVGSVVQTTTQQLEDSAQPTPDDGNTTVKRTLTFRSRFIENRLFTHLHHSSSNHRARATKLSGVVSGLLNRTYVQNYAATETINNKWCKIYNRGGWHTICNAGMHLYRSRIERERERTTTSCDCKQKTKTVVTTSRLLIGRRNGKRNNNKQVAH